MSEEILLKVTQARCLTVLATAAFLTRAEMGRRAGFTPASGTPTRVLHGLREGSSSGAAHPGILELGYAEALTVDHDGQEETAYRITPKGRMALTAFLRRRKLGAIKDKGKATNKRYQGEKAKTNWNGPVEI